MTKKLDRACAYARRLFDHVGRRGAFLLVWGIILITYGILMATSPTPPLVTMLLAVPTTWWSIVWMLTGALAIAQSLHRAWDRFAFTAIAVLLSVWAVAFAAAFVFLPDVSMVVVGGAVIWLGGALSVLIASGWSNPRDKHGERQL